MSKEEKKKKESPAFYKIRVNIFDGVAMINLFALMGGSDQEKILRKEVKDEFAKVFPEAGAADAEKPSKTEKRELTLSKRQVRAIAHSIIAIYGKDDTLGGGADRIQDVAKAWRIWPYCREMIGPESYPEFDGELADEPDLLEPELESKQDEAASSTTETSPIPASADTAA